MEIGSVVQFLPSRLHYVERKISGRRTNWCWARDWNICFKFLWARKRGSKIKLYVWKLCGLYASTAVSGQTKPVLKTKINTQQIRLKKKSIYCFSDNLVVIFILHLWVKCKLAIIVILSLQVATKGLSPLPYFYHQGAHGF